MANSVASIEVANGSAAAKNRFEALADRWKRESLCMSNEPQMALLESYQGIIGMGDLAVPFLLRELNREPNWWFWALESITQVNPVADTDRGDFQKMTAAWLNWGRDNGYDL